MLRQASSRNQRSKGFKVKHGLQILVLVAICIWLLYQVKHSHEKKRAFEERNSKIMNKVIGNQEDFFKFGRKDLPHIEERDSVNESQIKEEDNEETQEEEEEEEEHDAKQQEIEEEEGRGAGDDEINEQDNEKGDEEAEQGEEPIEEENTNNREEEKDAHEEVDVFDNQEHEGGTQEAREENYKRDDASSAVVLEEQIVDKTDDDSSANGSKGDDASNNLVAENLEKKVGDLENVINGTDGGSKGNNNLIVESGGTSVSNVSDAGLKDNETIQTSTTSSNVSVSDNNDVKVEFSKPENESVSNSITVEHSGQIEQANLTKEAESNSQIEDKTNSIGNISEKQAETQNNSTMVNLGDISSSNDTISLYPALNQNAQVEDNQNLHNEGNLAQNSNSTMVSSRNVNGDAVEIQSEEQSTTLTKNETQDAAQAQGESDNLSRSVITEEERDARMDLSTLPDIQNEVMSTDDEVAE